MNKYFWLILLAFVLLLSSCKKNVLTHFPNGKVSSKCEFKGKKLDGKSIYFFENGKIQSEFIYKNNQLNGISLRYNYDGKLIERSNYKNGLKHGLAQEFTDDGLLFQEIIFFKGLKNGMYKQYYAEKQQIKIQGNFKNDLYDGKWTFFDIYGQIIGEGEFNVGNGYITGYKPNSNETTKIEYRNNEPIAKHK